ncbi:peptide-N-glycosidase F-related protein [Carboxylicivirga marina]|uniref:Peptide-N-glycosidase F N-terminal domain-containing protein n=1 Tax=Carboxylicivirga marina TaxID=2800988 RepID=A0ABS1HRM1_9BACT|nr:PNGase F N-terminal domain-containing protein [Carboxylicivirga marina]MBK3519898.1 hypothetical protein [Carboxylicivirga marina]
MNKIIAFFLVLLPLMLTAQNKVAYKVSYEKYVNSEKRKDKVHIIYADGMVYLSDADAKQKHFIDLQQQENVSTINFEGKAYKQVTPFSELSEPNLGSISDTIMNYVCKHVSYVSFSNKVNVWYTEDAKAKGSPSGTYLPSKDALVLRILVNGTSELRACAIDELKSFNYDDSSIKEAEFVDRARFEELKINSRFTRLSVFKDEQINFYGKLEHCKDSVLEPNHTYHFAKGSVILKKIELTPEMQKSGQIYARLTCQSNGDAYDRVGSVFVMPNNEAESLLKAYQHGFWTLPEYIANNGKKYHGICRKGDYEPPIEIMRFFTTFGIGDYNNKKVINNYDWAEEATFEQEVTQLIPSNEKSLWVGVYVSNYSRAGHRVSLDFEFFPSFSNTPSSNSRFVEPLFSTINTMEVQGQLAGHFFGTDTLKMTFEIPEDMKNLELLYTTTGHGGWGGGDEFNPKLNQVFIDGEEVFEIIPWRTDCATYRLLNPASGNFANGLSSSDLSRSNWCPGTLTSPFRIPLNTLTPGSHTLQVVIDQGEQAGRSFNYWGVTGVLVGNFVNESL